MHEQRCAACGQWVAVIPTPAPLAEAARSPVLKFSRTFFPTYAVEGNLLEAVRATRPSEMLLGLDQSDRLYAIVLEPAAPRPHDVRVRLPHWLACAYVRNEPIPAPGDRGRCRGCAQPIFWIETPQGRKAPLDPVPHTGRRLGAIEARRSRGMPGYYVGLDAAGEQVSIIENGEPTFGGALAEDPVTVWVNHFATCPKRDRFTRPRERARD